jgi:AAA+ ATPase superfamily predicted ATPase
MLDLICAPNSLFLTDGKELLISEFGKEYGTYFSILKLISSGRNTLREINDSVGRECGPYLENLDREYNIVKRSRPIFSKENSRDVRWKISDNYLRFYFRYISRNWSLIEMEKYDVLKTIIKKDHAQYSGMMLEDYFVKKIAEEEVCTNIGSYWDRKGENEIDIVVLNDLDGKATLIEVKRNPKKAQMNDLKRKAETIHGLNKYDIEYRLLSLDDM